MPYQQVMNKSKFMADVNEARALRVVEIMNEFQSLQCRIAEYAPNPPPEEYFEEGYQVLRQCRAEALAVLAAPFPLDLSQVPSGDGEQEKRQLQRIIIDASARRFQAKKIYLRAVAAVRWSNTRNAILQGEQPDQGHAAQLQQANSTLRTELASITDARIINEFRTADTRAGYWLQDDPSRATILDWIRSNPA
ncbi:MAG: hypothetical protein LQ338_007005 [Usnochroma carphineum]|nr:MAG: hypothetical protein LQ338_007005 [Usnochroma carphineum]